MIQNKIEQSSIEEALSEPVTCEDGNPHYIDESNKRYLARQICQLFPQPLDDKGLREKIKESILDVLQDFDQYSPCLHKALLDKILALLPDIKEARRQERERIGENLYKMMVNSNDETDLTLEGEKRKLVFICNKLRPIINTLQAGQALSGKGGKDG